MRAASSAALVIALAGVAAASPADDAFKKGRELLKAKQWADACAAFEESQRLEPAFGTRFNIAQCSEPQGKLATALAIYRELAAKDTNATRKAASAEQVKQLEARVPKLQIQLDPKPASAAITLNGALACAAPCDATAGIPVDLGSYAIGVTAAGFVDATAKAEVREEGRTIVVAIRLTRLEGREVAVTPPPITPVHVVTATTRPAPTTGSDVVIVREAAPNGRKRAAIATLAVSGVALVLGVGAGGRAKSKWDEAKDVCGGTTTCPNTAAAEEANRLADAARTRGNIATVLFVAGGITAATGIYLLATSGHHGVRVNAATTGDSVGVTLAGRF